MGQITIEVPQEVKKSYQITDKNTAEAIITQLEKTVGQSTRTKLTEEDKADVRAAKRARAEYQRTGESYTVNELREKYDL